MKKKYLNYSEALQKLQKYCAYQERCQEEVRSRLIEYGIYGEDLENIIVDLITENFLNEERFAIAFTGGKFRIKHWGRIKIIQELKAKKISDYSIKKALISEINEKDYLSSLSEILNKKAKLLSETDNFKRNQKLAQYAIGKGYEPEMVWSFLKEKD